MCCCGSSFPSRLRLSSPCCVCPAQSIVQKRERAVQSVYKSFEPLFEKEKQDDLAAAIKVRPRHHCRHCRYP